VWEKFSHYNIEVDEKQDDKAVEILLCSFARPHMRYVSKLMNRSLSQWLRAVVSWLTRSCLL
jgi:hypothetical protein